MSVDAIVREVRHAALAAGIFVALVAPPSLDAQGGGSITGIVSTRAGALQPVRVTIDQRVCGSELSDEAVVASPTGRLANAVVTLAGVRAKANAASAIVMNDKCRFAPRVQVVGPNATVTTSSVDAILHTTNAQVEGGRTIFNVALPVPGIKINKPVGAAGLVRLSCNTHPWMRGWIVVTDEVAAVTDSEGRFTLPGVPAGTYQARVWHESFKGAAQQISVAAGQATSMMVEMR
jgi:hypothetical protein